MVADIYNKPVRLRQHYHSVSYGAYLLSATEMGIFKSLDEAAKTVSLVDILKPDKQAHQTYHRYYTVFARLSEKLEQEFEAIAALQH
jgi:gluconokinase